MLQIVALFFGARSSISGLFFLWFLFLRMSKNALFEGRVGGCDSQKTSHEDGYDTESLRPSHVQLEDDWDGNCQDVNV